MPEYIVRQVREAVIRAENINQANYIGMTLMDGDPRHETEEGTSDILVEPEVKVFVVEVNE